ncbi:MAG TPA: hypothetical protein VK348_03980 [Planctomycetota bacterium]|nr:hypothetical protein [Planctomycetota bacterium]
MPRRLLLACSLCLGIASALRAQNCAGTSIGAVPLSDLGTGTYQGFEGGLYGSGLNVPPPAHRALGLAAAATVTPRSAAGAPSPNGRIVLLSIGMSNCTQEFSTWVPVSNADPNRSGAVVVVDGAQGGQTAAIIQDPLANFWTVVEQRLATAGVTTQQVQAVWLKEANAQPTQPFPQHMQILQGQLGQIARNLKGKYPNVQLCFASSRTYGGYATTTLNPEPFAYESGFAVQGVIGQQLAGDPTLNADPGQGVVVAPWLGFGPYLWADGTTPRSDGLVWLCSDFVTDGTHPAASGRQKVADLLQAFFTGSEFASSWYLGGGTAAQFQGYGSGCAGLSGVPAIVANSLPTAGNLGFRVGVESAAPGRFALLLLAAAPASIPLVGRCTLLVDPQQPFPGFAVVTSVLGRANVPLPVPNDPGLVGLQVFGQWGIDDAAGTPWPPLAGLAASRGARIRIGD